MTLATEHPATAPAVPTGPSRTRRIAAPLAVISGLGLATLAVHLRDPHAAGSWGVCPSTLLGLWCPGCGGLRAVHDLTHLEVGAAFAHNPLVVLGLPVAVLALLAWSGARWRGVSGRLPALWTRTAHPLFVMLVLFMVLRNLPWFSHLTP